MYIYIHIYIFINIIHIYIYMNMHMNIYTYIVPFRFTYHTSNFGVNSVNSPLCRMPSPALVEPAHGVFARFQIEEMRSQTLQSLPGLSRCWIWIYQGHKNVRYGSFQQGIPIAGLFRKWKILLKWMRTGGTHILGNAHIVRWVFIAMFLSIGWFLQLALW